MPKIPVACIVEMGPDSIRPMRLRYEDESGAHVIKVDTVVSRDVQKIYATMNGPASLEYSYKCESIEEGYRKSFKLVYNNQSCKWSMFV